MWDGKRWVSGAALVLAAAMVLTLGAEPASAIGKKKKDKEKEVIVPFVPTGGWEAYIHDSEGRDRALLQPVEQNDDEDWMYLKFTEYKGPRGRLAVMRVENESADADDEEEDDIAEISLANIEELLATSLFNTNRFNLIERKRIQTALAEQDFGASDRITTETAAKIGKALGAEYLIIATITEWTPSKSRFGVAGIGQSTAEVAISYKVIDATSGQLTFAGTERATTGSWNFVVGGKSPPINYAVQACINKAAYKIASSLKAQTWRGAVAQIKGDKVYINAGSNKGIQMGMKLTALAKGAVLIDPETKLPLGSDTEAIGTLTVTTVNESFSIATIVQGCKGLKVGDQVEAAAGGF
jgi:curli biogenesis system outer membrane secretion channel CsgG